MSTPFESSINFPPLCGHASAPPESDPKAGFAAAGVDSSLLGSAFVSSSGSPKPELLGGGVPSVISEAAVPPRGDIEALALWFYRAGGAARFETIQRESGWSVYALVRLGWLGHESPSRWHDRYVPAGDLAKEYRQLEERIRNGGWCGGGL